jgi:hypothetical protein
LWKGLTNLCPKRFCRRRLGGARRVADLGWLVTDL